MTKTSESLRTSLLLLRSLWLNDRGQWVAEYPIETELYILNRVIRDLTKQHKYLVETALKFRSMSGPEAADDILRAAEDIYLQLQKAKDRFRYLKSKYPIPIWVVQIVNKLKLLLRRLQLCKFSCK
jgi:hypothetical protein